MTDLAAFLRARLDADEEWANDAQADSTSGLNGIARRMLREVEAKRRIIARYEQYGVFATAPETPAPAAAMTAAATLKGALYDLAAVYSDHPDYDPAWTS